MWASVRGIKAILWAGALLAQLGVSGGLGAEAPPSRVVSINLCTDQLAMLLAAPGQLHSVTYYAADPDSSPMADAAQGLVLNSAMAEDIYLMQPDLVVAGRFTASATVSMLRRLGVEVVVFDPAYSLADITANLTRMGEVLGRADHAAQIAATFDTALADLRNADASRLRAALYQANGYTSGSNSLAGEILTAAGYANIADELGLGLGGFVALEVLAMTDPDMIVTSQPYAVQGRADAVMHHPVLAQLVETRLSGAVTNQDWVCGTPYVLRAIERLAAERPAAERPTIEDQP